MNVMIVILLLIVLLIPLWLLFGKTDTPAGQIPKTDKKQADTRLPDRSGQEAQTDIPGDTAPQHRQDYENDLSGELTPPGADFSLPHSNSSVIDPDSPFNIYRRTLDNAQHYLQQGDFDTARDLYNGLMQRISDTGIREKLEENIDYLNNYQQIAASREHEKKLKSAANQDNDIRVTMGGQEFVPDNIKIDITPPNIQPSVDMDELLEQITGHVAQISPAIRESNSKFEEIREYRGELEKVTQELRSLYDLKEESHRAREDRIDRDLEEIKQLRNRVLTENQAVPSTPPPPPAGEHPRNEDAHKAPSAGTPEAQDATAETKTTVPNEQKHETPAPVWDNTEDNAALQQLSRQVETLSEELKRAQNTQVDTSAFHNQLHSLQDSLQNATADRAEIGHLQEKMDTLTSQIAEESRQKTDIQTIQQEIRSLNEKLDSRHRSQDEINSMQQQIGELRSELREKEEKAAQIDQLKGEMQQLQNQLQTQHSHTQEMAQLKDKIEALEAERRTTDTQRSQAETDALREQIAALQNERARLQDDAAQREQELAALQNAQTKLDSQAQTQELSADQLNQLRSDVQALAQDAAAQKTSEHAPPPPPPARQDHPRGETAPAGQPPAPAAPHPGQQPPAPAQQPGTTLPDRASVQPKPDFPAADETSEAPAASYDTNINLDAQSQEDSEDDFETLQEHLEGPQFAEPSEDEILEKILADTAAEKERDYEIRGTDDSTDISNDFDISKLFSAPPQPNTQDEEFYSQFMEKHKPRVKKELPILNVSYRFDKLPELSTLSKESNIIESTFYKYKELLEKANEHIKRRQINDALNYYNTVLAQDIPEEFKNMIRQNINDLNEYLEKYMLNM